MSRNAKMADNVIPAPTIPDKPKNHCCAKNDNAKPIGQETHRKTRSKTNTRANKSCNLAHASAGEIVCDQNSHDTTRHQPETLLFHDPDEQRRSDLEKKDNERMEHITPIRRDAYS